MSQFDIFASVPAPKASSPWMGGTYVPDLDRLTGLLSRCAAHGTWRGADGGDLGIALDLWVADELRRAGYETDAVWPRSTEPRVLPPVVARAISRLPKKLQADPLTLRIQLAAGAAGARVQGEFFAKSVDVVVADWDRGVELMVSTKAMASSFTNNLNNRWEEFVGDLRNIRGRHPLAALGVVFLADFSIVAEDYSYQRLLDMLRKLRLASTGHAYDATMLLIARPTGDSSAELLEKEVPEDLAAPQFFKTLVTRVFERLPASERATARSLFAAGGLNTAESNPQGNTL